MKVLTRTFGVSLRKVLTMLSALEVQTMGEYQYYERQTMDRPLTGKEQAEVKKLSSHIAVSSTGAWVEYNCDSFKHSAREVGRHCGQWSVVRTYDSVV